MGDSQMRLDHEFESPTPPKKGGQKTEQVIYTISLAPPTPKALHEALCPLTPW
jgi:hypothetical protein